MKSNRVGYEYEEKVEILAQRCVRAYVKNDIEFIKNICEYHNVEYTDVIYKIKQIIRFKN